MKPVATLKLPNDYDGNLEYHDVFTRDQVVAMLNRLLDEGPKNPVGENETAEAHRSANYAWRDHISAELAKLEGKT